MHHKAKQLIQDYENAVAKIIVWCVGESSIKFGIKKIIGILKGAKSTFVLNHKLYELAMYGIFSNLTASYLQSIIEILIEKDILAIEMVSRYENMPVLALTSKSRDFLRDKIQVDICFAEQFIDREIIQFTNEEKQLFNSLKQLRRRLSNEKDLPAFMVCGDVTLREITKQKPTTIESLHAIRGVGEKFVQNYSHMFLEVIKNGQE